MCRRAVLLGCAIVVVVLWVGCSGDDQRPTAVPEQPVPVVQAAVVQPAGRLPVCIYGGPRERACDRCQKDEDCLSGFCVDGGCANISIYRHGHECNPNWDVPPAPPRPATTQGVAWMPSGPMDPCPGWLCIDRRCRSCTSDEDCRRERGRHPTMAWAAHDAQGEMCGSIPERPGYHCYSYSAPIPPENPARITPVPARPAVVAPEGGFPHRSVAAGGACVQDGDCRSLFCDRGECAEIYGRGKYGLSCDPAEYQGTVEEIRKRASAEDGCGGYVCRDQRCRACQSDSDCPHGLPAFKCVRQELYWGKVCAGLAPPISSRDPIPPPHRTPAPAPFN
jgi:hypothetical protein